MSSFVPPNATWLSDAIRHNSPLYSMPPHQRKWVEVLMEQFSCWAKATGIRAFAAMPLPGILVRPRTEAFSLFEKHARPFHTV